MQAIRDQEITREIRSGKDILEFEQETIRYEKAAGGCERVYTGTDGMETDRNNFMAQLSLEASRPGARVTAVASCEYGLYDYRIMEARMSVTKGPLETESG